MGYRLEVRNTTNFGWKTFKLETLSDVKKVLNDYLFEGEVKLYEEKEISLPCDYERVGDHKLTDFGQKHLLDNSCVRKEYIRKNNQ